MYIWRQRCVPYRNVYSDWIHPQVARLHYNGLWSELHTVLISVTRKEPCKIPVIDQYYSLPCITISLSLQYKIAESIAYRCSGGRRSFNTTLCLSLSRARSLPPTHVLRLSNRTVLLRDSELRSVLLVGEWARHSVSIGSTGTGVKLRIASQSIIHVAFMNSRSARLTDVNKLDECRL